MIRSVSPQRCLNTAENTLEDLEEFVTAAQVLGACLFPQLFQFSSEKSFDNAFQYAGLLSYQGVGDMILFDHSIE